MFPYLIYFSLCLTYLIRMLVMPNEYDESWELEKGDLDYVESFWYQWLLTIALALFWAIQFFLEWIQIKKG